jgi:DNA-directed RNA polymerase alpha subunit
MTSMASSKNSFDDKDLTTIKLPVVKHGIENKGVLTFTLENTNVSIANALRRVLLSDINSIVFDTNNDKINIYENTTRFHNEILKQRLGCIPVHIKDNASIENLIIELNGSNESDSIQYVTSKDFMIKDIVTDKYLTEEQTKSIFPPNEITKEYVLFTRLRPKISNDILGEKISLKVKLKTSTAKKDGMYNVVSTCAFGNTEDKVEQHNQWQSISEDLESKELNGDRIEYERKNWYTLQAKRYYIKDSFDFKVESVGVYTNVELINMGCDNIIKRLDKIKEKCDKEQLNLNKKSTAMENAVDVILEGEDYTIGKVIEFILHEQYYKKDRELSYVGFIKKHPHDDYSIVRMAFSGEGNSTLTDVNVYRMVNFACDVGIKLFANIKEYF